MPIIFQQIRHLFLRLFCAETAINLRYMITSRNQRTPPPKKTKCSSSEIGQRIDQKNGFPWDEQFVEKLPKELHVEEKCAEEIHGVHSEVPRE